MPTFDYKCGGCGHTFELLILPKKSPEPACPKCESQDLEQLLSAPAISSEGTKAMSRKSGRARDRERRDDHARFAHEYYHKHHDMP